MNPIKEPIDIIRLRTGELKAVMDIMIETGEINPEQYQQEIRIIDNGRRIRIPLIYIIEKYYTPRPNTKTVKVKGYGTYNIVKFDEEIKERENLMRTIILENMQNESPTEGRQTRTGT